ncbi:hypothetical protein [Desulforegula conservatrix]|uniref:hypothetical protein n=1 Tax=Desulforegula conservatrix TaxID=153026 RepID=UPI000418C240|nr:hypothetical protein [Desulforegula conservatrix]
MHYKYSNTSIFNIFTRFLEDEGIKYCIVGNTSEFSYNIEGDVDIVIESRPAKEINKIISFFSDNNELCLVQMLQHEQCAYYFVLFKQNDSQLINIKLDICSDYLRNGKKFLKSDEILSSITKAKNVQENHIEIEFFVPSTEMNFIYYLLKKTDKKSINQKQYLFLKKLWNEEPESCLNQIKRFWQSPYDQGVISTAFETNNQATLQKKLPHLKDQLHRTLRYTSKNLTNEIFRLLKRICQPTGLFVVIMGPDGSGKSTVINAVRKDLEPAFRNKDYFHLKPDVFKRSKGNAGPVLNPHNEPPRTPLMSYLKLLYFLTDYVFGYFIKIKPRLIRSSFVVFDRYYHDLLVDPKRYRFASSMKIAKFVGSLIPKPDLWIFLNASPEEIQKRKQEVPFEESQRACKEYLKLASTLKNSLIIDASQPADKVINDVNKAILTHMANRFKQRHL